MFKQFSVIAISLLAGVAIAADVKLSFSDANNVRPAPITVTIGAKAFPVVISARASATKKRDLVEYALKKNGFRTSNNGRGGNALTLLNLPSNQPVSMNLGNTGEVNDRISTTQPDAAQVNFSLHFDPTDRLGQPAVFRAGIVTDVGELYINVSAAELNFQTDGPIICQALFQRLAPRAPQYGTQINYVGDRLEVYFDPAYTVTQGGIIFGTTSRSAGCSGTVMPSLNDVSAQLRLSPSMSNLPVGGCSLTINPTTTLLNLPVHPSGNQQREAIQVQAFNPAYCLLDDWTANDKLVIRKMLPGSIVTFANGTLGAPENVLTSTSVVTGNINFFGHFNPIGQGNAPAIFTAGIVTDVGTLTAHVSASELNFQTDGPIICQALFQRLAPQAPQYGAQVNYVGDRLEVYFDPAYSVASGGITFGTTSSSPGCSGQVVMGD